MMAGFSSVTGNESIMFADNCSFDGTQRNGRLTTDGQLFIGSTTSPHIKKGSITSPLGTLNIGYSSPDITLDVANGVGPPQTPLKTISDFDDFLTYPDGNLTRSAKFGWTTITNLWEQSPGLASNPGIIYNYAAGVDSDAIVIDGTAGSTFLLGSCSLSSNFVMKLNTLSDVTNRYVSYIGITDDNIIALSSSVVQPQNGCFFKYSDNINSGNWQIVCGTAGVYTTVNTSVAPTTNFQNFGISINSSGTAATFTIDGVQVGTVITTNIPTTTAVGPAILLEAVSGNITIIYLDLYYYLQTLSTARPGTQTVWSGTMGFTSIVTQTFTTSGTYTPTTGMQYCQIECIGGGGGGGAADNTGGASSAAGGGGAGGYSRKICSASDIGVSQSVVIGAGGASQSAGATSSVGSLIQATGGSPGADQSPTGNGHATPGGLGGVGSLGDLNVNGSPGGAGISVFISGVTAFCMTGIGGSSYFGGGGIQSTANSSGGFLGSDGLSPGAGGSGGATLAAGTSIPGGKGADGIVIITEYI